jgi:hypothetical protein
VVGAIVGAGSGAGDTVIGGTGRESGVLAVARGVAGRRADTRETDGRRVRAGSIGTRLTGAWWATGWLGITRMRAVHISR